MDTSNLCFGCFNPHNGVGPCPHCGFDLATAKHPFIALPIGTILNGRYLTGRVLGVGGFGVTYLAMDLTLEIAVAIKEFLPSGIALRDADHYTMTVSAPEEQPKFDTGANKFLEEARLLAKLRDVPNIVTVQDYFRENNTAYFVMEYIEGVDLMKYTQTHGGKLSFDETLRLTLPIIDSLAHVHAHNLLHRDISPDNIVVMKNGSTRLLDFGAARLAIDTEKSKSIILKHGFAPEEQYRKHGNQGPWSDEYALAATMYLIMTGVMPPDAIERVHEDTLVPPIQLGVEMPQYANDALMKALAVSASDRFPDMTSFSEALTGRKAVAPVAAAAPVAPAASGSDALPTGAVSVSQGEMVGGKTVAMDQIPTVPQAGEKVISPSILAGEAAQTAQTAEQQVTKPKVKKSIWKRPLTYVLAGLILLVGAAVPAGIYISQNYEWVSETEETTKRKPKETTKKTTEPQGPTTDFADPDIEQNAEANIYTDEVRNFSITAPANYSFENKDGVYRLTREDERCVVFTDFISEYDGSRVASLNDFVALSGDIMGDYISSRLGYTDLQLKEDVYGFEHLTENSTNNPAILVYDANAYKGDERVDVTFVAIEALDKEGVYLACGIMAVDEYGMYSQDDWSEIATILASFDEHSEQASKYTEYVYNDRSYFSFQYNMDHFDSVNIGKTQNGLDCVDLLPKGVDTEANKLRIVCLGDQSDIVTATDVAQQVLGAEYRVGGYTSVTPTVRTSNEMRIRNYTLTRDDDVNLEGTVVVIDLSGQYFAIVAISDEAAREQIALDFTMVVQSIDS